MKKLVYFLYTLLVICLGVLNLLFLTDFYEWNEFVNLLNSNYNYYIVAITVVSVIIIFALFTILSLLKTDNRYQHIVKYTSEGEITITYETIKSLAYKAASQVRGLKEIKIYVKPQDEKLNLLIRGFIMPDTNITQTVNDVQRIVKSQIETIAEIGVGEVKVIVDDVASTTKLR